MRAQGWQFYTETAAPFQCVGKLAYQKKNTRTIARRWLYEVPVFERGPLPD
jgi:hypothetical protein